MTEIEFVPLSIEELQTFFPQYDILAFIAAGGMGAVYLANQKSIDRKVAIKVLPRELSADEEFSKQFRAEAKVMARVNHPNVVSLFDFGEVDGMFFIIMEFVDGKSLHHSANGVAITPDVAQEVTVGLLEGIKHAHDAGILHRDIKPGNVLLDSKVSPKIGDFGLARPVEESEAGKVIYGTPGYTAPEVVTNPELIDERSDIFSIGVILYELLVGHLPDQENYVPPSKLQPVPKVFDRIIQQAIAPDPDLRYPDTSKFLEDLKSVDVQAELANASEEETGTKTRALRTSGPVMERSALSLSVSKTRAIPSPTPRKSSFSSSPPAKVSSPKLAANKTAPAKSNPIKVKANAHPTVAAVPRPDYKAEARKAKLQKLVAFGVVLIIAGAILATQLPKILASLNSSDEKPGTETVAPIDPVIDSDDQSKVESGKVKEEPSNYLKLNRYSKNLRAGNFSNLPEGTITIGKKAFFFYDQEKNWIEAQHEAISHGGYLACPSSSEIADGLIEVMLENNIKEVWTGGGTTHGLNLSWMDGGKWRDTTVSADKSGAIVMDDHLSLKVTPTSEERKFFIAWDLEGDQLGSFNARLDRAKASAKEEKFSELPPGFFVDGDNLYFIVAQKINRKRANDVAGKAKGSVAVIKSQSVFDQLCEIIPLSLPPNSSAWVKGTVLKSGKVDWGTKEKVETLPIWLEKLEPASFERSIVIRNNESFGLISQVNKKHAQGVVIQVNLKN